VVGAEIEDYPTVSPEKAICQDKTPIKHIPHRTTAVIIEEFSISNME
jgi:hypothetical protein